MAYEKSVGLYLDVSVNLRKELKAQAAIEGVSVKALTTKIIEEWLDKNGNMRR